MILDSANPFLYTSEMAEIYSTLFERVVKANYSPDKHLKEQDLAGEFGISRTPVREALRQLAEDGLVEILPKRGARVIGFTADDVEEIYDIRLSLELLSLRYAGRLLSIERLREIRGEVREPEKSTDYAAHEAVDTKFHNYIIDASGKRRIISTLRRMFRLIQHFRELGFQDSSVRKLAAEEHLEMIDALCVRDLPRAESALKNHIERSKSNAVSQLVRGEVP